MYPTSQKASADIDLIRDKAAATELDHHVRRITPPRDGQGRLVGKQVIEQCSETWKGLMHVFANLTDQSSTLLDEVPSMPDPQLQFSIR